MVRCGVVEHPRDWAWVGFHEIMGRRKRYRLIDLERLGWRLGADNVEEVPKSLIASLAERIARNEVIREPCWTESLAVGSLGFVEKVKPLILFRRKTEMVSTADDVRAMDKVWRRRPACGFWRRPAAKNARITGRDARSTRRRGPLRYFVNRPADDVWVLQEAPIPYGQKTSVKNASKAVN